VIKQILLVAAGGALGSAARYLAGVGVEHLAGRAVPLGTLAVNVAGCFIGGVLLARYPGEPMRLLVVTGFLGGLTTFSAFGMETVALWQKGHPAAAIANVAATLLAGLASVALGCW
jgi:fluoride exporter